VTVTVLLWAALLAISLLVTAVSFVHLLCRESLRITARELPSLQFYRSTLQDKIGLDAETGALAFSLIRHFGLLALAVVTMAVVLQETTRVWLSLLEAFGFASLLMLATSYVAPRFLYRNTTGKWSIAFFPLFRLMAAVAKPIIATLDFFQSIADLGDQAPQDKEGRGDHRGRRQPPDPFGGGLWGQDGAGGDDAAAECGCHCGGQVA
jgi:hypothetical protein